MYSVASEHRNGALLWRVSHDAQKSIFDIAAEGALPGKFQELRDRTLDQQKHEGGDKAEVDYVFDIPLLIAQGICGFRHDETSPDDGGPKFTRLVST